MKTLFLVGAGCTRNYQAATHSMTGLQPPLNRDFFKMARKVLQHDLPKEASTEVYGLLKVICELYKLDFDNDLLFLESEALEDLERVMTNVVLRDNLFGRRAAPTSPSPYETMRELIAWTIERSLQGPTCKLHKQLARLIEATDVVVSMNYDVLFDVALREAKRIDDLSYGVTFYRVHDTHGWNKPREAGSSLELLKLHGSLDWGRCIECSTLLLVSDVVHSLEQFHFRPLVHLKCPRCERDGGIERLIIPPIQSKEYNEDPYRFLWLRAARKVQNIDRIVALGYRFSENDFAVEALLRQISAKKPDIYIMNSTRYREPIEIRLLSIFPDADKPKWTTSLLEFVEFYKSMAG